MTRIAIPTALAALLIAGCGAAAGSSLRQQARHVAVLQVEVTPGIVMNTPSGGTLRMIRGAESARGVLRDTLIHGLQGAGFSVQARGVTDHKARLLKRGVPAALAKRLGVDAVLLSRVDGWDTTHVRGQGRLLLNMAVRLVRRDGKELWSARTQRPVVTTTGYRARQDYRALVTAAVDRLLRHMP